MADIANLARFFKALSDETRLQLVGLLAQQESESAFCVTRLARELDTSVSNVSQHLRVLKDLGLVRGERRGYRIHYFLDLAQLSIYGQLARKTIGETAGARLFAKQSDAEEPSAPSDPGDRSDTDSLDQSKEVADMCKGRHQSCCCSEPERAEQGDCAGPRDPQECTPEQIRECHGENAGHPCAERLATEGIS